LNRDVHPKECRLWSAPRVLTQKRAHVSTVERHGISSPNNDDEIVEALKDVLGQSRQENRHVLVMRPEPFAYEQPGSPAPLPMMEVPDLSFPFARILDTAQNTKEALEWKKQRTKRRERKRTCFLFFSWTPVKYQSSWWRRGNVYFSLQALVAHCYIFDEQLCIHHNWSFLSWNEAFLACIQVMHACMHACMEFFRSWFGIVSDKRSGQKHRRPRPPPTEATLTEIIHTTIIIQRKGGKPYTCYLDTSNISTSTIY